MHIHLDPVGGIAGDMFAAGILDIWPEMENDLKNNLKKFKLIEDVEVNSYCYNDSILTGTRFDVIKNGNSINQSHKHHHVSFSDIKWHLEHSLLTKPVIQRAIDIFHILAKVEAKVHDKTVESVTFHEVGAWDSIADIISAAFLIEQANVSQWSISSIPIGSGRISSAHGLLPVPAPAVSLLLDGFKLFDDGVSGERVTPTGAAILRHLEPLNAINLPTFNIISTGYGFGTKKFKEFSNVLRLLVIDTPSQTSSILYDSDQIAVIEFEVDDQTSESLSIGLDKIRSHSDVLDVTQSVVYGKKNRISMNIQILAKPNALQTIIQLSFMETTTIGLRYHLTDRVVLKRSLYNVQHSKASMTVKVVKRSCNNITAKTDIDEVANIDSHEVRENLRNNAVKSFFKGENNYGQ